MSTEIVINDFVPKLPGNIQLHPNGIYVLPPFDQCERWFYGVASVVGVITFSLFLTLCYSEGRIAWVVVLGILVAIYFLAAIWMTFSTTLIFNAVERTIEQRHQSPLYCFSITTIIKFDEVVRITHYTGRTTKLELETRRGVLGLASRCHWQAEPEWMIWLTSIGLNVPIGRVLD